ncbi:class I SAM-dependent methyltransferase [Cellulomonas fimi]|uniref:class I SAM-dependent methyltransferase n=1 Tax=Cellulomonas fimi TaxID=1708 RepID=UPI001E4FB0D7|nr:methyltransferase domain-containing protein [Cellulomonas fimi]
MSDEVVRAVRDRFDGRAPSYDGSAMHQGLARAVAEFADLVGVTTVLDVATGTGLVLRALRDLPGGPALRLAGVDVSAGMLGVARATLPDATLTQADARRLPVADRSVDLLTCVTGLHLIPDTARVVEEWVRVLRPGGRVLTATFAELDPSRHHRELAPGAAPPYPVVHDPFRTPEALGETVAASGLRVLRHAAWTDGYDRVLIAELGVGDGGRGRRPTASAH